MICQRCQAQYESPRDKCPKCGALSSEPLNQAKKDFLELTKVNSKDLALRNALQASLRHSGTYRQEVPEARRAIFRKDLQEKLTAKGDFYQEQPTDTQHIRILVEISNQMSVEHGTILRDARLRIGVTQKALNLYLKFLWCLDSRRATPPHCPIDRGILQSAGIYQNWTDLDSIEQYLDWIKQLRATAAQARYSCIAEWELRTWQQLT